MQRLWAELRRRNIFRVAAVYLAAAWLLAQIVAVMASGFEWPSIVLRVAIIVLAVLFPVTLVIAWLFEITPEGMKATKEVEREQSIRALTGRKLEKIFIGLLALVVVALVGERFLPGTRTEVAQEAGTSKRATAAAVGPSIAVLPFQNFSPDPDQDYFADGISEEILNSLAQINGLKVISRTSSFSFKGKNEDLRQIGRTLGVATILEGSVRKAGNQVRITAQLVNTGDGSHFWSQTYDRDLKDIFSVQEDIAKQVSQAIGVTLGVGKQFAVPGMTRNVDAYDEYLRGISVPVATASAADSRASLNHLERAVTLDPDFAIAWVALGNIYAQAVGGALALQIEDAQGKLQNADKHVASLIPNSPVLILNKAGDARSAGAWLQADGLYQEAVAATRDDSALQGQVDLDYGVFLSDVGRTKEAISYLEQARSIDPLNLNVSFQVANAYASAGDLSGALAEIDRGAAIQGDKENLIGTSLLVALATGDRQEIDKRITQVLSLKSSIAFINVIHTRMRDLLDDPKQADAELKRLAADPQARSAIVQGAIIPQWAAPLGDPEFALAMLRKLPLVVQRNYSFSLWRPIYKNMRPLMGFKDMARDIGLVDYWRKSGNWGDYCHRVGDDDFACD